MAKPKKENKVIQEVEQEFEAIQNNDELSDREKEQQTFLATLQDETHKKICERIFIQVDPFETIYSSDLVKIYYLSRKYADKPSNNSWFVDFGSMFESLVKLLSGQELNEI